MRRTPKRTSVATIDHTVRRKPPDGPQVQSEQNWTLAVGLYQWVSDQLSAHWGLFAAGATISALPVLALFLFLQRYIVGGITAGSVKA